MFDTGCEYCGDLPKDLFYLRNYTETLMEYYISIGAKDHYIESLDLVSVCSCGVIASERERRAYNQYVILCRMKNRKPNDDFTIERDPSKYKCTPF
jgi:hypothetical protein